MGLEKSEQLTQVATQAGGTLAVFSGLSTWLSENYELVASIGVVAGIIIGLSGLAANIYFARRKARFNEKLATQIRKRE